MNLNDIMQAAQGGQGVNNLASQFGLTPQQTQAAIQAMIPAFSTGFQRTAQDPTGLGGLLSQLASGAHTPSFADPAQTAAASNLGGNVLGQIFGSPQIAAQIGQQASRMSGVDPQVVQQMMPAVASILMGGLAHMMNAQGMGGVLGQFANAAAAPAGAAPTGAAPNPAGGLLGAWSNILGGMFGSAASAPVSPQAAAIHAGLNTFAAMLQAGIKVSQAHQQGLNEILQSINNVSKG